MVSVAQIRNKILPHISRIFSAPLDFSSFRYALFASFLAVFALNIWMRFFIPSQLLSERTNLLLSPFSHAAHIAFAKRLYTMGLFSEAKQEVQLSSQGPVVFPSTSLVLGIQSEDAQLLSTWENQEEYVGRAFVYWQSVVMNHPDYRDAYVTLSVLAHQLYLTKDVEVYLRKAYSLDPDSAAISSLATQLGVSL